MKIILKDFQDVAVGKLVRHLRGAARDSLSGDRQSVCLSSTTGSGKTVMLTRAIELMLEGDDEHAPLGDAVFLWITDDPQLNEQTRKKMLATSSFLKTDNLIVIDSSFDEETFHSGAVHFLNIQKIGREKSLVTPGDKRTYSLWETIRNTIDALPGKFFVIVDEAHRGMIEDKGQEEAASIIQKFVKGSPGEIPAVPIVVGISATPERFNRLIVGTSRMNRPIDIDVADVRESGLIKETIVLHHPNRFSLPPFPFQKVLLGQMPVGRGVDLIGSSFSNRNYADSSTQRRHGAMNHVITQVLDETRQRVGGEIFFRSR